MPRGRPRKTDDDVLLKSAEFLGWALGGLEREIAQTRERLTSLTAEAARLRERLGTRDVSGAQASQGTSAGSEGPGAAEGGRRRRRRRMSPEARKRISEMMKKRWAERRKRNA
jgi:hypothetical protein